MLDLHAYAYRVPRIPLQMPVEFWSEGSSISGVSRDLSDTGLHVRLAVPVMPGRSGQLRLRLDACSIEIKVEVAHSELLDAGLRFCFSSAAEEHFIKTLVRVLSRGLVRSGPYPSTAKTQ